MHRAHHVYNYFRLPMRLHVSELKTRQDGEWPIVITPIKSHHIPELEADKLLYPFGSH